MQDDIEITVGQPQQKSQIGGVNKYHVFPIRGRDSKGEIQINRRYSDFHLIREVLLKRWPGCYISSLPSKKTIGAGEQLFVESRRRGLEIFLQTLSYNTAIWNSEELNIFLRNPAGDIQKQLSPLLKESNQKLLTRYRQSFVEFDTGQIPNTVPAKISQFSSYLRDSKVFLQKLNQSTDKMSQIYKTNIDRKLALLEFTFPDYERHCLLQNDQKRQTEHLLFCNEDFGLKEVIQKYKKANEYPSVMVVRQEIKRERKQLQAFEEMLKGLHEIQALKLKSSSKVRDSELKASKINAGKQSLFSKITKQSKEAQLAQSTSQTQKAKQQQKLYLVLSQIISNLIGLRQIDRFKQLRQKAYYRMLKVFAKSEREMAQIERDIWVKVGEHDRIGVSGGEKEEKNGKEEKETEQENREEEENRENREE